MKGEFEIESGKGVGRLQRCERLSVAEQVGREKF
jgi:hypothetical protein